MRFGKGTAKDGEVLCEHEYFAAFNQPMPRYHSIARIEFFVHPKISRAMLDQLVEFLEGAFIEEELDALARRHLTGGVLLRDAGWAATFFGALMMFAELLELGS